MVTCSSFVSLGIPNIDPSPSSLKYFMIGSDITSEHSHTFSICAYLCAYIYICMIYTYICKTCQYASQHTYAYPSISVITVYGCSDWKRLRRCNSWGRSLDFDPWIFAVRKSSGHPEKNWVVSNLPICKETSIDVLLIGVKLRCPCFAGLIKLPIWGNQTIEIYGNFEGFPENNNALFGLVS